MDASSEGSALQPLQSVQADRKPGMVPASLTLVSCVMWKGCLGFPAPQGTQKATSSSGVSPASQDPGQGRNVPKS